MSALMRHLTGGWRRPRSRIVAAAIAAFSAGGLVAWAAWSSQGNGPGAAKALSMPAGNTPPASVSRQAVTGTVTPAPPANEPITFMGGSPPLGSGPLDASGSATLVTASLSVATHTISASYAGDSNFAASSGSTVQVVNKASTSVAVTSSDSSAVFGESLSVTTTVTAVAPGAGTPDGTVQFKVDGVNLGGTMTLSAGTATSVATTTLSVGSHTVTAVYSASTNFTGATGTLSQTVGKAATSTGVTASSPNPSVFGQAVTFTATVNAMPPGAGTSTGSVQFFAGTANLGAPVAVSSGVATSPPVRLAPVGDTALSALYLGHGNFPRSAFPSFP